MCEERGTEENMLFGLGVTSQSCGRHRREGPKNEKGVVVVRAVEVVHPGLQTLPLVYTQL